MRAKYPAPTISNKTNFFANFDHDSLKAKKYKPQTIIAAAKKMSTVKLA